MKRESRRSVRVRAGLGALAAAWLMLGCGGGGTTLQEQAPNPGTSPGAGIWAWQLPANFPTPKVPEDNPMSAAKVELGRFLFYDRRLSGNGQQACASCHQQDRAFTDGLARSLGSTGEMHPRNAQGLANVVYNATLTWANPSLLTLERQMETPLFGEHPVEMGVTDANRAEIQQRLRSDAGYGLRFAAAFPGEADPVSWAHIVKAIASFQRSLLSGNGKYDRWLAGKELLNPAEERGMRLFFGEKAECFHCHGSFNFNDQVLHFGSRIVDTPFHNTGLFNIGGTGAFPEPNRGVFELSGRPEDMGKFRAPSLRNVEFTAPYMHDGSFASLEQVVAFYAVGGRVITSGPFAGDGRASPLKSDLVARIDLNEQEQADLVAFLKALSDHEFIRNPRHADPFAKTP
ncbi:MAG: di-heme enzyme [Inhella sp.]